MMDTLELWYTEEGGRNLSTHSCLKLLLASYFTNKMRHNASEIFHFTVLSENSGVEMIFIYYRFH